MSSSDENKDADPEEARKEAFAEYCKTVTSLPTETVLEDIREGKNPATAAVANLKSSEKKAFVERGLIPIVLDFLKRCEGETLADVIGEQGDGEKYIDSPGVWVGLLANIVTPDTAPTNADTFHTNCANCMEIAENIEPLIKCMRDDKTREFFKSKKEWALSYSFAQALLLNIVMINNNALDVLLQYEGFLEMLVQCLFWQSHRPDIKGDEYVQQYMLPRFGVVKLTSIRILYLLFAKICKQVGPEKQQGRMVNDMTNEEKKQLYKIGVTPIVNEAYDPNCTIPFAAGLLQLVKNFRDAESKKILYFMLGELAVSECVDELVIKSVINIGYEHAWDLDLVDAKQLPRALYRMLNVSISGGSQPHFEPVDARYGVAIDAGLFQMCFKMLLLFGEELDGLVCDTLGCILQGATAVAFHDRSSKAIANVRSQTQAAFRNPELMRFNGNAKCENILHMLSFFCRESASGSNDASEQVDGAATCRNCSKALEKDAIKRCSRCKKAVYCSRDCQAVDWKASHKRECKAGTEIRHIGLNNASKRDAKKIEDQAGKLGIAAREMFAANTDFLLKWCIVKKVDALDCVAIMNFCTAPPSFHFEKAAEFLLDNPCDMRPGEQGHKKAKELIAKNREAGAVTGITIVKPAAGAGNGTLAAVLMDFPGKHLIWKSWQAAQVGVKGRMFQEGWRDGLPYHGIVP